MVGSRRFVFIAAQFWGPQNVKNESSHLTSLDHIRTGSEKSTSPFPITKSNFVEMHEKHEIQNSIELDCIHPVLLLFAFSTWNALRFKD